MASPCSHFRSNNLRWNATMHDGNDFRTSDQPAKNAGDGPVRLNQTQLAGRWCLSPRTLERWRWSGDGPSYIKVGARVVYRLEDIEAYEVERLHILRVANPRSIASRVKQHGVGQCR
jgi:hypothetical protein